MRMKKIVLSVMVMMFLALNVGKVYAADEEIRFVQTQAGMEYQKNGVTDTSANGFVQYEGQWFYLKNGIVDQTLNGFADYNGGSFFVAAGRICIEYSGLVQDGGKWYFLSKGQFQKQYTGLALYDGEWFLLQGGMLDSAYNGLYTYDGAQFLIAEGRICGEYSGLFQYKDKWYFIAEGQVSSYTGLTIYDGVWFYVSKGILDTAKTGYIAYNGDYFFVSAGQLNTVAPQALLLEKAKQNVAAFQNDINVVYAHVNEYRAQVGAAPVQLDYELCLMAEIRSIEMAENSYFEHQRPNGDSCFTVFKEFGYAYYYVGENIARNYATADSVSAGWYNSSGHYANMTDTDFTNIGIGVAANEQGIRYWTQVFATPRK